MKLLKFPIANIILKSIQNLIFYLVFEKQI